MFNGQVWFDRAENFLRAEQEAERVKEAAAWTEVRKPHLEVLKEVLAAIDALKEDDDKILGHIYKEHPPKNSAHTRKTGTFKSQYKHALIHYHPDKHAVEDGAEWKVRSALSCGGGNFMLYVTCCPYTYV